MFVSDRILFLELHKTGCTHIRNLLMEFVGGEFVGKHNQAPAGLLKERIRIGSVRNPWDWYLSLWAFGCDRKGSLYRTVTTRGYRLKGFGWGSHPGRALVAMLSQRPSRNPQRWQRVYQDVDDAGAFRQWLHMVHDAEYRRDYGEGYARLALSRIAGLYSYRYMKLFACKDGVPDKLDEVSTTAQLQQYEHANCFIDHFIRNERLEADLFDVLEAANVSIPEHRKSEVFARPRTNTSSKSKRASYYYDAASRDLVSRREDLIIRKFGYALPDVG